MSRGWFTLFLYSGPDEAQSTEIDIEVSHTVDVDISKYTHANASIDAEIEVSNIMHIDIGKVSPFEFEGDE